VREGRPALPPARPAAAESSPWLEDLPQAYAEDAKKDDLPPATGYGGSAAGGSGSISAPPGSNGPPPGAMPPSARFPGDEEEEDHGLPSPPSHLPSPPLHMPSPPSASALARGPLPPPLAATYQHGGFARFRAGSRVLFLDSGEQHPEPGTVGQALPGPSECKYKVALRDRLVDAHDSQLAPNVAEGELLAYYGPEGPGGLPMQARTLLVDDSSW
jgi:hypothetical protein